MKLRINQISNNATVTVLLIFLLILLLLFLLQRIRTNRQTSLELKKRLRVYALSDDYFFEYDYAKKLLAVSMPPSDSLGDNKMDYYERGGTESEDTKENLFWSILDDCRSGIWEVRQMCTDHEYHWLRVVQETIYDKNEQPAFAVGKIHLIDAEKEEKTELRTKAQLDGLTGVYNIQTFQEQVALCMSGMKEENGAFILLDVDHFKEVNDKYGHMQGDTSLCQIVELIRYAVRKDDIIGRYGGDEFVIYFTTMENAEALEKRCESICQFIRYETAQSGCPLTVSIGAVFVSPGDDYKTVFHWADDALYTTKRDGRNGYAIYGNDKHASVTAPETEVPVIDRNIIGSLWLKDKKLEAVLRSLRAVAFEFHAKTGRQYVSSFINEYLQGNYDGRPLSTVMLEDGIIHPQDVRYSIEFRECCQRGDTGEMTLRLLSKGGEYRWHRMIITHSHEFGKAVFVGVLMDVDSEIRQKISLRERAEYDQITKIYNRQKFNEVTKIILEADPDRERFLVRFDIDRFKLINELYSTEVGDHVLCMIGDFLKEDTYEGETYGRLRDDVFAVCLKRSRAETTELLRELEKKLNETDLAFQFVISAGVVHISHYSGETVSTLCDWATMAQRTVKGNYMCPFAFYDSSLSDALNREHFITASMKGALEEGEFMVYLQPQFDISSGEMIGAEALARWVHPEAGMISPGEFIPLFERNSFILPLDEYIWEQTYALVRRWMDMGYQPPPVSVNVSRLHLYDTEFCGKIEALCNKYAVPPSMVHMEITESAYAESPEKLYDIMDELQGKGFSFSMDDFGSGYSSLNVLKDIPVDIVKIDLNFLNKSRRGADSGHLILEGTVRLIRDMGLPIIAEGVETEEQLQFLKSIGCTAVQGYYYAKPMPPGEYEEYLKSKVKGAM